MLPPFQLSVGGFRWGVQQHGCQARAPHNTPPLIGCPPPRPPQSGHFGVFAAIPQPQVALLRAEPLDRSHGRPVRHRQPATQFIWMAGCRASGLSLSTPLVQVLR
jgi:hypothetical protein